MIAIFSEYFNYTLNREHYYSHYNITFNYTSQSCVYIYNSRYSALINTHTTTYITDLHRTKKTISRIESKTSTHLNIPMVTLFYHAHRTKQCKKTSNPSIIKKCRKKFPYTWPTSKNPRPPIYICIYIHA